MAERFLQGRTPAHPCSQSGPLLFLARGCSAPMGRANLARYLLQPECPTQPLSFFPCFGPNTSSKKVPEWAVTPSVPLALP